MKGVTPLDEALATMREQQASSEEAFLDRLKKEAPDLADLVEEGRMKLSEAFTALTKRNTEVERHRSQAKTGVEHLREMDDWVTCIELGIHAGARNVLTEQLVEKIGEAHKRLQQILRKTGGQEGWTR